MSGCLPTIFGGKLGLVSGGPLWLLRRGVGDWLVGE